MKGEVTEISLFVLLDLQGQVDVLVLEVQILLRSDVAVEVAEVSIGLLNLSNPFLFLLEAVPVALLHLEDRLDQFRGKNLVARNGDIADPVAGALADGNGNLYHLPLLEKGVPLDNVLKPRFTDLRLEVPLVVVGLFDVFQGLFHLLLGVAVLGEDREEERVLPLHLHGPFQFEGGDRVVSGETDLVDLDGRSLPDRQGQGDLVVLNLDIALHIGIGVVLLGHESADLMLGPLELVGIEVRVGLKLQVLLFETLLDIALSNALRREDHLFKNKAFLHVKSQIQPLWIFFFGDPNIIKKPCCPEFPETLFNNCVRVFFADRYSKIKQCRFFGDPLIPFHLDLSDDGGGKG